MIRVDDYSPDIFRGEQLQLQEQKSLLPEFTEQASVYYGNYLEWILGNDEGLIVMISLDEGGIDVGGVGPGPVRGEYDPVPVVWDDAVRSVLGLVLRIGRHGQGLSKQFGLKLLTGIGML